MTEILVKVALNTNINEGNRSNLIKQPNHILSIPRVTLVKQQLLTLPEKTGSYPVFSRSRVAQSLFLCIMFCRSLFVLFRLSCLSFDLRVLFIPLISFTHNSPLEPNTNEDLFYRVIASLGVVVFGPLQGISFLPYLVYTLFTLVI